VAGGIAGYTLASLRPAVREAAIGPAPTGAQEVGTAPTLSAPLPTAQTQPALPAQQSAGTVEAVKKAGPAVVTVITTLQQQRQGTRGTQIEPTASGSGVILSKDGYILTNNHVIEDQKKITVIFASGEQAEAKLVGGDSLADLAILKVDIAVPAVAELGDSDAIVPGQPVVAIGSALGDFRNTVTAGIISGVGRRLPGVDYRLDDLIQTDAAINHGNSGGPLVNMAGQVVGINVAIYRGSGLTQEDTVEGVGFAIPVNTVKIVAQQLIANGKVSRAYIGISYQMLTPQLASFYSVQQQQGAYVTAIVPNTPASKAGLQEKDVIVAIEDRPLSDSYSLFAALLKQKPGDTVKVKVMRAGKELTLNVTLTERPADVR
jgi:2-alkenal reductase